MREIAKPFAAPYATLAGARHALQLATHLIHIAERANGLGARGVG